MDVRTRELLKLQHTAAASGTASKQSICPFVEDYMTAGTHDRAFTSAPVTELFYMKAR
jgi:hypothetical protein